VYPQVDSIRKQVNNLEIKVLSFLWQNGPAVEKEIFAGISVVLISVIHHRI